MAQESQPIEPVLAQQVADGKMIGFEMVLPQLEKVVVGELYFAADLSSEEQLKAILDYAARYLDQYGDYPEAVRMAPDEAAAN